MSNQTESRGWEIEEDYHEHDLDSPYTDVASELKEGGSWLLGVLLIFVVAGSFLAYGLHLWLQPPSITFAAPQPPAVVNSATTLSSLLNRGYGMSCIYVDNTHKFIRPNYANPNCNEAAAKKRGEF